MTFRRLVLVLGAASLAVAVAAIAFSGTIVRAGEAARLILDLGRTETAPGPPLGRTSVSYAVEGRPHVADLYQAGEPAAALVLVPGAAATGKDDPRLVALANALVRARFLVLVPDLPRVRELRLSSRDARDVGDAVLYLAARPGTPQRLGAVGVSYALGPVILAALDPKVGERLAFVVGIGGYYDARAVLAFFTTGYYRTVPGGRLAWRRPNDYGKWLFVLSNLDYLKDGHDAALLSSIARRKLGDPDADVRDLAAGLGPEGRAVLAFADNKDEPRVEALFAALPRPIRDEVAALDLKTRDLSHLSPRFLLLHGRDDPIIPDTESERLAAALPAGRTDLFLVDRLSHVDMEKEDIATAFTLWRAAFKLMDLRDGVR
jgi:acetyl esterase/lipase